MGIKKQSIKQKKTNKMKKYNNNPTTSIKCKFSNAVHKLLEPNIEIKRRDRWSHQKNYELSDKEKLDLFNKIVSLHTECSNELTGYQYERREKKRIHKDRVARGYKFKSHTKKEDYLKSSSAAVA